MGRRDGLGSRSWVAWPEGSGAARAVVWRLGVRSWAPAALERPLASDRLRLLFVCSRNQWRSPTAEAIWRKDPRVEVRSAGTSPRARRRVSAADLRWADLILVMEDKHEDRLRADFGALLARKAVQVLDIPDEFKYMDPALVEQLRASVEPLLPPG